jgi:hypothetical protein
MRSNGVHDVHSERLDGVFWCAQQRERGVVRHALQPLWRMTRDTLPPRFCPES